MVRPVLQRQSVADEAQLESMKYSRWTDRSEKLKLVLVLILSLRFVDTLAVIWTGGNLLFESNTVMLKIMAFDIDLPCTK